MNYDELQIEIAEELISINERQVSILDQENTDGETWNYYCTGQIIRPAVFQNRISGTVREYVDEYNVEITANPHEISSSCTCGTRNQVCKHVISLLYSWVNDREEFINIGKVVNGLYNMDKEELIKIIERVFRNNPSNVRFLRSFDDNDELFDADDWLDQ